jgi:hypothetical protein
MLEIVLPDGTMLHGDYSNGLNPKDIRWTPWTFDPFITTALLFGGNELLLGSNGLV